MDGRLTENTSPLAKKTYIISFIYGISDLPLFELVRVRNFRLKCGWRFFELKTTSRSGNEKMKFEVMRVQNIRLKLAAPRTRSLLAGAEITRGQPAFFRSSQPCRF